MKRTMLASFLLLFCCVAEGIDRAAPLEPDRCEMSSAPCTISIRDGVLPDSEEVAMRLCCPLDEDRGFAMFTQDAANGTVTTLFGTQHCDLPIRISAVAGQTGQWAWGYPINRNGTEPRCWSANTPVDQRK